MNFLTRFFAKRAARRAASKINELDEDKLSLIATEFLKTTQEKYSKTLRDAEKINKAKLFSLKEKQLREQLADGLEDDDEEEYEEEAPDTLEETIKNALIQKFLGNIGGATQTQPANASNPIAPSPLASAIQSLTPQQIEQLKKKFLG